MPVPQAFCHTGSITIAVRNRARPSSTWLDGVWPVPSAWRSRPSTMMMRVKAVSTSSIDGIRVIAVISSRVCSGRLTAWPPILPTFTSGSDGVPGMPGAAMASAGSAHSSRINSKGR
ncbi:hypothetical protein D3C86_545540 [compost metagenome]